MAGAIRGTVEFLGVHHTGAALVRWLERWQAWVGGCIRGMDGSGVGWHTGAHGSSSLGPICTIKVEGELKQWHPPAPLALRRGPASPPPLGGRPESSCPTVQGGQACVGLSSAIPPLQLVMLGAGLPSLLCFCPLLSRRCPVGSQSFKRNCSFICRSIFVCPGEEVLLGFSYAAILDPLLPLNLTDDFGPML